MSKTKYSWGHGYRVKADPFLVAREFQSIEVETGQAPTPEEVINSAEHPANPMHGEFEWNDSKAAHEHRLSQARYLLRALYVRLPKSKTPVRAYISLVDRSVKEHPEPRQYYAIEKVLSNTELFERACKDVAQELQAMSLRYAAFVELRTLLTNSAVAVQELPDSIELEF